VTVRVSLAPQARLPILHKTLGVWLAIFCGPMERRISRQHCPVCGDERRVEVVVGGVLSVVECPGCESTAGLLRLLERGAG
jgi:hypothetical protein